MSSTRRLYAAGLLLALSLTGRASHALDVNAVYRTACQRDIGVILQVDKRRIHLLLEDGSIKEIQRHEVVSLVYYPVAQFSLAKIPREINVKPVRIHTRDRRQRVELAFGWPINFSDRKLSLLLPSGKDFTVDKNSIWSLAFDSFPPEITPSRLPRQHIFEHPQTSGFCRSAGVQSGQRRVFPQQILNDRVVIRRELDRLMTGYEELLEDMGDQKFYPVPQIYRDRTSLGYWGSILSRYGSSETRSNSLTPLLTNTYSSGPFRYQHIFFTGSTPNGLLIHNESQTQIFYRFKAAYFHTSLLVDPSLALVGEKYFWRKEDLADETLDDRVSEFAIVELGFDLGPVALQLQPVSMAQAAVKFNKTPNSLSAGFTPRSGPHFNSIMALPLWRAGLRVMLADWTFEAMGGYVKQEEDYYKELEGRTDGATEEYGGSTWEYAYGRLNVQWNTPWHDLSLRLWSAVRHLTYEISLGWGAYDLHRYTSLSISNALQAVVPFLHRFEAGLHVIMEVQRRQYQDEAAETRALPKLSIFVGMSF